MIATGFTPFDNLSGGLDPGRTYLLYGGNRSGKSTFALGFTSEGLSRGERCVYVSVRPPESIVRQAAAFGFDFESHVASQNLVILEYPDNVRENSTRLLDDSRIFSEFKAIMGAQHFDRLVFDTISPLVAGLSSSAASSRLRSMIRLFSAGGATALYVVGIPDQDGHLAVCKEIVHGILRFEREGSEGSPNTLMLEQLPGIATGPASALRFDIVPGIGLRETTEAERPIAPTAGLSRVPSARSYSPAPVAAYTPVSGMGAQVDPPVLLIHPDSAERSRLRGLIEQLRPTVEAFGAADGMSQLAIAGPSVVVLAREGRGVSGLEIARKIRHSGRNVPILMLASQCRRSSDLVGVLQAGIDICLEDPPDPRLLLLNLRNLLLRPRAGRQASLGATLDFTPPLRESASTTDFEYFMERLAREARFADVCGGPVVLITLRQPFNSRYSDELSNVASVMVRPSDLILTGERGVGILLADASSAGPFLARFRERWSNVQPMIDEFRPAANADYLEAARDFLLGSIGRPRVLAADAARSGEL